MEAREYWEKAIGNEIFQPREFWDGLERARDTYVEWAIKLERLDVPREEIAECLVDLYWAAAGEYGA